MDKWQVTKSKLIFVVHWLKTQEMKFPMLWRTEDDWVPAEGYLGDQLKTVEGNVTGVDVLGKIIDLLRLDAKNKLKEVNVGSIFLRPSREVA